MTIIIFETYFLCFTTIGNDNSVFVEFGLNPEVKLLIKISADELFLNRQQKSLNERPFFLAWDIISFIGAKNSYSII